MGLFLKKIFKKKYLNQNVQLRFMKRLTRSLEKGYPLLPALEAFKWDTQLNPAATVMIHCLKNGNTIDQAFEQASFHPSITSFLFIAEANGDIIDNLTKCTEMFEKRMTYLNKLRHLTRYPLLLFFIFSILLFSIKYFVFPSFIDIFSMSLEISTTIKFSIIMINGLISIGISFIILGLVSYIVWHFVKQKVHIPLQIKFYQAIPIYRNFMEMRISFLFAAHLSTLLKTGISLKNVLNIIKQQKHLPIIAYYAKLISDELEKGMDITEFLLQLPFIDKQFAQLFQQNTNLSDLERDLTIYADIKNEEFHHKIMNVITLIQPIFFIILASFIILIYISLMWPMFQLIRTI